MSALVHEHTPLLCALGGAAAGEKHSVCQSDGSPGLGERGEESREGDRYVPTRHQSRPAPRSQVCFCVRKEKLNDSPVPRAFAKHDGFPTRCGHGYGPSLEGLRKELGSTGRHWAHRDQTWTSCAVFYKRGRKRARLCDTPNQSGIMKWPQEQFLNALLV